MLLSIIIPVYGVERFISRCLDSVFRINLPESDYEVICIDDCSPDSSATIVEGYKKQHLNLILIKHDINKKQGGARNTGVDYARGEYLLFVDADDLIPEYDVLGILHYMKDNHIELLLGAAEVHKKDGSISRWGNSPLEESSIMTGPEIFKGEYIHKIAFGVVWMGIYNAELARRIPPFLENVWYEDTDWTLCCAYNARLIQYRPLVIYSYMENTGSTTTSYSINKLINKVKQGIRVWDWAQTTTQYHDDVVYAAEDYCTWNLQCLSSLKYYGLSDRALFFNSFSKEEMSTMKQWRMGGKWMRIIRHPFISRIEICCISPVFRFVRCIKSALNGFTESAAKET